jgi:hypothetical protein
MVGRGSGVAVSGMDAGLVIVRSHQQLREMKADLHSGQRRQPAVGLACLLEIEEPVLAPRQVRALVGGGPWIYYLPGEHLLRRLQGMLGQRLALSAGGARVWWPGLSVRSDPGEHPLVLALDGESRADTLAEFARQFDLNRPVVRAEIRLIEDARRLAEHELSQALEENRALKRERELARTCAQEAERALQAAGPHDGGCGERT